MKSIFKKCLFILLICIVIFFSIQYIFILNEGFENNQTHSNTNLVIDKCNRVSFNKIKDDYTSYINQYVPKNSIESISIKTGVDSSKKHDYNKIIQLYKEHLVEFSNSEKEKLQELIEEIVNDDKFNQKHNSTYSMFVSKFKKQMKWNLLKTRNLELNLPCTISNYILFPESQLKTKNWCNIKETLMHEQIHILQRQNQELFNEEYKRLFNNPLLSNTMEPKFHLLPINKDLIDYSAIDVKHIQIQNPDEDDLEWIIYDHNLHNYYVVPYIVNRTAYYNVLNKNRNIERFSNKNSKNKNMPYISTITAFRLDLDKSSGPNSYIVTGNQVKIQELEYYKYLMGITNNKHINIAHPNETFTDLFLTM